MAFRVSTPAHLSRHSSPLSPPCPPCQRGSDSRVLAHGRMIHTSRPYPVLCPLSRGRIPSLFRLISSRCSLTPQVTPKKLFCLNFHQVSVPSFLLVHRTLDSLCLLCLPHCSGSPWGRNHVLHCLLRTMSGTQPALNRCTVNE